jgi:hypothetical protein
MLLTRSRQSRIATYAREERGKEDGEQEQTGEKRTMMVTFRGRPLTDSPARSQSDTRKSISARALAEGTIGDDDRDAVTLANTRCNEGFHRTHIRTRVVRRPGPPPPSPSHHFRSTSRSSATTRPKRLDACENDHASEFALSKDRKVRFAPAQQDVDACARATPPYYDTMYPLRTCIRPSHGDASDSAGREDGKRDTIIVQRVLYVPEPRRAFRKKL